MSQKKANVSSKKHNAKNPLKSKQLVNIYNILKTQKLLHRLYSYI